MKSHLEDRPLWLTTLAEADCGASMPPGAEANLLAAARRNIRNARLKTFAAFATAAALVAVLWIPFSHRNAFPLDQDDESQELLTEAMAAAAGDSDDATGGFTPTLYASSGQPIESLRLVRVSMPKESLAKYGLRPQAVADLAGGDEVAADLLVGQDGIARAIRVPPVSKDPRP